MNEDRDERALDRLVREAFHRVPDEPAPADEKVSRS